MVPVLCSLAIRFKEVFKAPCIEVKKRLKDILNLKLFEFDMLLIKVGFLNTF